MKNIRKMSKEELELMSYNDIAYYLLKEKKDINTAELFKEICSMLEMDDKQFENKIGDFYTSLTNDQRFILLDSGNWDLKENHSIKALKIDDMLDEIDDIDIDDVVDDGEIEEEKEILYDDNTDDDVDDITEEYKNLVIVDEEELDSAE